MDKIGVIGGDGFIGSHLVKDLGGVSITKKNYAEHKDTEFDVLINANGNSNKFWANNNPAEDFELSAFSVYKSLFDFKYKKYIYISSIDVEKRDCYYGLNKLAAEDIVSRHCPDYSIVRLPLVIGEGSTKGVVYDILNGNEVYLSGFSQLMIVDVKAICLFLNTLLFHNELSRLECFYPNESISVYDIGHVLGREINYADTLRIESYDYKGTFKSSEFYLNKYK